MKLEVKLIAPKGKNKYWAAEIVELEIHTQGKNRLEAALMAANALETLVDTKGFKVRSDIVADDTAILSVNDESRLMSFILRRIRSVNHLTLKQVARNMRVASENAYARYEQGKAKPSLSKFEQLLSAVSKDYTVVFKRARA